LRNDRLGFSLLLFAHKSELLFDPAVLFRAAFFKIIQSKNKMTQVHNSVAINKMKQILFND